MVQFLLPKKGMMTLGDKINEDNLFDSEPAGEEDCIKVMDGGH